ncbi:MAG: DUF2924 domain-containing protein [Candidatus Kerfeldbacteria bacterium]|nr:DUF2924 domain-containing protein [Candidatus Kerfeldbacteria bacterium]
MTDAAKEIAKLSRISRDELRKEWQRVHRADPPDRISRDLMMRALAYSIQEQEYGGLDKATRRRLRALAQALEAEGEIPASAGRSLKAGAKLVREWHGETYTVVALEEGFEFKGQRYRSLSRIAREITGSRWSGHRFFGLRGEIRVTHQPAGEAS